MAAPAALGQLEGFLGNLNLGKYFEVMRDNEVRRHHPRQRRPVPASPWALPGADLHRDGRRWRRVRAPVAAETHPYFYCCTQMDMEVLPLCSEEDFKDIGALPYF